MTKQEIETLHQNLKEHSRVEDAVNIFMQGYNCSQSIFAAYADLFGIDKEQALLISAGTGAGIGRMREVCGTIVGAAMILGLRFGSTDGSDHISKSRTYRSVSELAEEFKSINSSIICKDMLKNINTSTNPMPDERTAQYYKKRPCIKNIRDAAILLEKQLLLEE